MALQNSCQLSPRRSPRTSTSLTGSSTPAAHSALQNGITSKVQAASPSTVSSKTGNLSTRVQPNRQLQAAAMLQQEKPAAPVQSTGHLETCNSSAGVSSSQYAKLRSLPGRTPRSPFVTDAAKGETHTASIHEAARQQDKMQSHPQAAAKRFVADSVKQSEPIKSEDLPVSSLPVVHVTAAATGDKSLTPGVSMFTAAEIPTAPSASEVAEPRCLASPAECFEAGAVPQLLKPSLVTVNGCPVVSTSTVNLSQAPRAPSPALPEEATAKPEATHTFCCSFPALTEATEASRGFSIGVPVAASAQPAAIFSSSFATSSVAAEATAQISHIASATPMAVPQSTSDQVTDHISSRAPQATAGLPASEPQPAPAKQQVFNSKVLAAHSRATNSSGSRRQLPFLMPMSAIPKQQIIHSTSTASHRRADNSSISMGQLPARIAIKSEHGANSDQSQTLTSGMSCHPATDVSQGMVASGLPIASGLPVPQVAPRPDLSLTDCCAPQSCLCLMTHTHMPCRMTRGHMVRKLADIQLLMPQANLNSMPVDSRLLRMPLKVCGQ